MLSFLWKKLSAETEREIVRTSQAKRQFLFVVLFFLLWTKISAGENAKLWGRLRPSVHFPQKEYKLFMIFSQIWARKCEHVSEPERPFLKRNDR